MVVLPDDLPSIAGRWMVRPLTATVRYMANNMRECFDDGRSDDVASGKGRWPMIASVFKLALVPASRVFRRMAGTGWLRRAAVP
jgi:hypothetical protein